MTPSYKIWRSTNHIHTPRYQTPTQTPHTLNRECPVSLGLNIILLVLLRLYPIAPTPPVLPLALPTHVHLCFTTPTHFSPPCPSRPYFTYLTPTHIYLYLTTPTCISPPFPSRSFFSCLPSTHVHLYLCPTTPSNFSSPCLSCPYFYSFHLHSHPCLTLFLPYLPLSPPAQSIFLRYPRHWPSLYRHRTLPAEAEEAFSPQQSPDLSYSLFRPTISHLHPCPPTHRLLP